ATMERKVTCVLALVLVLVLTTQAEGQADNCNVAPKQRNNCGFSGITREQCEDRGCCFNDKVHGVPWCFH
ncbi:Trefoil factor 1, partial [Heterocephalus glaber]